MSNKSFHRTLPQKRMGSGALFLNEKQEILLVKPSYKPGWEIPGGIVEKLESPLNACRREVWEEIGIEPAVLRLLCVDYLSENDTRTEGLMFIFYGGTLNPQAIRQIRIDGEEIINFAFVPADGISEKTSKILGRRILKCIEAFKKGDTLYLEDQE
ncbi:NUDIX domain-containing protein [Flavilitoribacter nigricans]|uniref:NUDIX hydrolase n=1 Tax=Flavilitoribacter nigricans (strain ATCC 23147 / DSM 23189 / NBRC 102662 / NCIMB 1420 / SS-2) TaxID=1122177 RepID=A0A2D0N8D1_FLAN2|nr:NUDIX hydrolase [Flavilitoribacter nigricans]PHN04737.1 NUDIX hydrolase [Flavilitoribacter nigricans DSM 23189 = NBRC 102662]